jgi:hypothetical protein
MDQTGYDNGWRIRILGIPLLEASERIRIQ